MSPPQPLTALANGRFAVGLAVVAGALNGWSFGIPHGYWLAIPTITLLILLWLDAKPGKAARIGLAFGFSQFAVGVWWIYNSLSTYGNMPPWMAIAMVATLALYMGSYNALVGWAFARIRISTPIKLLLLLPALWLAMELIGRQYILTGFPWLHQGYMLLDTPWQGFAYYTTVYGLSLILLLFASTFVFLLQKDWRSSGISAAILIALAIASIPPEPENTGRAIKIATIQANLDPVEKWQDPMATLQTYADLTQQTDAALIVWPEAAAPMYREQAEPYLNQLAKPGTAIIAGFFDRDEQGNIYNSLAVFGEGYGSYRKRHLVPFGEYLPLRPLFGWVLDYLEIPFSDITPGEDHQPLMSALGIKIGAVICYEDAYPNLVAERVAQGAELLITASEEAWFGTGDQAVFQRLQMARMRAVENRLPVIRSSNTARSALIDATGRSARMGKQVAHLPVL